LRIEYDGAHYHVTSRGNERKTIFRDHADRKLFLNMLSQVTERFHWLCHAYCLMNNHYHLVIDFFLLVGHDAERLSLTGWLQESGLD
jgi:putative transposase